MWRLFRFGVTALFPFFFWLSGRVGDEVCAVLGASICWIAGLGRRGADALVRADGEGGR